VPIPFIDYEEPRTRCFCQVDGLSFSSVQCLKLLCCFSTEALWSFSGRLLYPKPRRRQDAFPEAVAWDNRFRFLLARRPSTWRQEHPPVRWDTNPGSSPLFGLLRLASSCP
jgi:hypothetical protein